MKEEESIPNFDDILMHNETSEQVEEEFDILDHCENFKRKVFFDTCEDYFPSTSSLELSQVPMNTMNIRRKYKDGVTTRDNTYLYIKFHVTFFYLVFLEIQKSSR